MTGPAIRVENLCKQYGSVLAVDNVSFEIAPGELVGFLGQNGAGKTTTMRILTTFMPASSGRASVAGHDVMYESMGVRNNLGYLQESVPLYPEMRVEEYLTYRAKLKKIERTTRSARIDYCIERCRVKGVRRRLLNTLSKGYRQRVGLADALLADPKVLILDEPLTGLDPIQQDETLGAIRELGGQHTVLFSSHHLPDVEKVCDRVIIIDRGKIRFDDKLSNLSKRAPKFVFEVRGPHDAVEGFFKGYSGVEAVGVKTVGDDIGEYEVSTLDGQDLREPIINKLVEHHWGVRRVEVRRVKVEDIFSRVVYGRE
jgi:ABC-2 type transport system ATP-binding protein